APIVIAELDLSHRCMPKAVQPARRPQPYVSFAVLKEAIKLAGETFFRTKVLRDGLTRIRCVPNGPIRLCDAHHTFPRTNPERTAGIEPMPISRPRKPKVTP